MNPDIHQEIYGMPEYMGALLSASLSHSADKFRKLYYDNGPMPDVFSMSVRRRWIRKA
jgi:capsid portal protein